jgi:hypothetical protein
MPAAAARCRAPISFCGHFVRSPAFRRNPETFRLTPALRTKAFGLLSTLVQNLICASPRRVQLKVKSVRGSFRRFGERTRPACWCRRPADTPEIPGGTPRPACGTQALPGKILRAADASDFTPSYTPAPGARFVR